MTEHEHAISRTDTESHSRTEELDAGSGRKRTVKFCWTTYKFYCSCGHSMGGTTGPEHQC